MTYFISYAKLEEEAVTVLLFRVVSPEYKVFIGF